MENEAIQQPLDLLLTRLGLTNADLVNASTEQLTFKMVNKGRKGRRLSPNVQEKILNALLAAKPDLKVRRRDLFRYELNEAAVGAIGQAFELAGAGKITYPEFVDLLEKAGITGYTAEVAANRYTFYGTGGEAHVREGAAISTEAPGSYNEEPIKAAIAATQKRQIDHPTFLKRIHDAGVITYEVSVRRRRIDYKGEEPGQLYREAIPQAGQILEPPAPAPKKAAAAKSAKPKKSDNTVRIRKTGKFVKKHRTKKRHR